MIRTEKMVVTVTTMVANNARPLHILICLMAVIVTAVVTKINARPLLNRPSLNGRHCDDRSHLK